jgi:hypothetical protein
VTLNFSLFLFLLAFLSAGVALVLILSHHQ